MTPKLKKLRLRVIVALAAFVVLYGLDMAGLLKDLPYLRLALFLAPYLVAGYDVIKKAFENIRHGHVFDENFLMLIATVGAFAIGEYPEGCAVMIFYQIGELFQGYAVGRSRASISAMMDIAAEYANLEDEDGNIEEVDPDDVEPGSVIVIRPGERVPLDGVVIEGASFVDTVALTGEAVPRSVSAGDDIISGCVNGEGTLKVRTTKSYDDSTVARILELVENATEKKAKIENFITVFAKWYTPVVTIGAVVLAVGVPLVLGGSLEVWMEWIKRACIFLVISCPCALVISVPLGFFAGIGAASKMGVLVKGSNYLEALSDLHTVVFDKTGTLTRGEFRVSELIVREGRKDYLLETAAHAEGFSTHPIAASIREAYENYVNQSGDGAALDMSVVGDVREIPGCGLVANVAGDTVLVGNEKLMKDEGIDYLHCDRSGTLIYVARAGEFIGTMVIKDTLKDGAKTAMDNLRDNGVKRTVMLTGDMEQTAREVAEECGIDEYHSQLLPGDKVYKVEELLGDMSGKRRLAFVGDGINDAPVLARADIGIAMGSMGSDAAIEAADVVLMDDSVEKIGDVVKLARRTVGIVRQNVVFALTVKFAVLILGAFGLANMWEAVFADVGVCVIAILNSMRALNHPK
ncbi:MAG: heavy metal translocating P-type ATPase [Eubacterium sp.]|nr:heavy metal translocating P-type ATPase [Eubacterium sp.]